MMFLALSRFAEQSWRIVNTGVVTHRNVCINDAYKWRKITCYFSIQVYFLNVGIIASIVILYIVPIRELEKLKLRKL